MTEETDDRRVSANSSVVLHHARRALCDCIAQLSLAVVPVDMSAHAIATLDISFCRWPHSMTSDRKVKWVALHAGEVFAHVVTHLGVQRERSSVKTALD